jgi:hypothetical protein
MFFLHEVLPIIILCGILGALGYAILGSSFTSKKTKKHKA